jgi:hypothetical protein
MTLNELIDELRDMLDDFPELGDEELKIAYQQNYPLAADIVNVTMVDEEDDDCECEYIKDCTHQGKPQLWIATSDCSNEPYAPKAAWRR